MAVPRDGMDESGLDAAYARIAAGLRWGLVLVLASILSFLALLAFQASANLVHLSDVWEGVFMERVAEIEELLGVDEDAAFLPDSRRMVLSLDGRFLEAPDPSLEGAAFNPTGLFGKIGTLEPESLALVFYPDFVDGRYRLHVAKRSGDRILVASMDPRRFFGLAVAKEESVTLVRRGIVEYSSDASIIGDPWREGPLRLAGGRLALSQTHPFPVAPETRLVVSLDITWRAVVALGLAAALVSAFVLVAAKRAALERSLAGLFSAILANRDELRASLEHKEALVAELYHRSYNNMNVILAMVGLQAALRPDQPLAEALPGLQRRVSAMAAAHRLLIERNDLSRLDLGAYLAEVARMVGRSAGLRRRDVGLEIETERVPALLDTAVPCGIIVNELVCNAFVHAFPEGRGGLVRLRLRALEDGRISLAVSDDGVGPGEGVDLRASGTAGLVFAFELARQQLKAEVAVDTTRGVSVELRFRDDRYSARV